MPERDSRMNSYTSEDEVNERYYNDQPSLSPIDQAGLVHRENTGYTQKRNNVDLSNWNINKQSQFTSLRSTPETIMAENINFKRFQMQESR